MTKQIELPELPYEKWKKTKMTLHLVLQIIGKVRLKMTPRKNHWWFITEYISPKGFSIASIPYNDGLGSFEITLNVHKRKIEIITSLNQERYIPLQDGLSIADFYNQFMSLLEELNIKANILDKPFDLDIDKSFSEITEYHHFDFKYIYNFWKILLWVDGVMNEFSGKFYGKTNPVQLYWHHMDLAVTRFSGIRAPKMDASAKISDKDAYTHEVISFGFWAGDNDVQEPAFYSYTYPSPPEIENKELSPENAAWVDSNGSPMAFYRYQDLLMEPDPRQALLNFFESAYQAGAQLANWDIEELRTPDLSEM
jgi:uncharacterized protein DUF5996